jgi:hypothetical protein
MVQDFTAFRKISFQTVDVEVALAEIEYQYLKFICEATLRNSDEVLREQIRHLHISGLPSFDDWRKQDTAPAIGILVPSIETNTIPTTAIESSDSATETLVEPEASKTGDRKPAEAPAAKPAPAKPGPKPGQAKPPQTTPSGSAVSSLLQVLSDQASAKLTSREVIEQQHEKLTAVLKEGKSMDELAALLTSNGAKISSSTLRNYLSAARRKAKTGNATTAGKAARAKNAPAAKKATVESSTGNTANPATPTVEAASTSASSSATAETTTNTPPAPAKPKRGRPKAAAKAKLEHEASLTATREHQPSIAEKTAPQAPALKKRKYTRK